MMDRKKIKYLFLITGMPMGGAERVMATLANEFVKRGHQVRLVTLKKAVSAYELDKRVEFIGGGADINSGNFLIKRIPMISAVIKGTLFYRRQLREYKPDIILSFLTYTNLLSVINNRISRVKYPVVVSERCDPRKRSKLLIKLCNIVYPLADCIVCQSKVIQDYFLNKNPKSVTKVIPNPVNEECINKEEIIKRRKLIVAVGRLSNQKNYDLLIDAFSDIANEYSEYRLEIYGEGPERERLQKKINRLGLNDRIQLMGTKTNVMKHIADAQLFVMSSNFEGFPNALAEAMASGLPVISTNFPSGVAKELIIDGENGYVVDINNREQMADAMRKILGDPLTITKMSKNNVLLREKLNVKTVANMWENLFNDILEKRTKNEKN